MPLDRSTLSMAAKLAEEDPDAIRQVMEGLSETELNQLLFDWEFWARPNQLAPAGSWRTWVIMAGRGYGKTRAGAEWTRKEVNEGRQRIALIGETYKDLVEVMVYGESGIDSIFPEWEKPKILTNPSVQIEFHTGAVALGYNATQPSQLRGPQFDAAWCDELAKWRYATEMWDQLSFGLRLGDNPQALITTTPRNIPTLKRILEHRRTVITSGSTEENYANLAQSFIEDIYDRYAGTRLGRQELSAELLSDLPGALWARDQIDALRLGAADEPPTFERIIVAIDPSGSGGEGMEDEGDDIGIVVAARGTDKRGYVLADRTCNLSPAGWGMEAKRAFTEFRADRVIGERNFGGAMIKHVLKTVDQHLPYRDVVASRGKVARAEPIAALYEQGRISHVGTLGALEDEMCLFTTHGFQGEGSPNRTDALVWALTELFPDTTAPMGLMTKSRK